MHWLLAVFPQLQIDIRQCSGRHNVLQCIKLQLYLTVAPEFPVLLVICFPLVASVTPRQLLLTCSCATFQSARPSQRQGVQHRAANVRVVMTACAGIYPVMTL